MAETNTTSVKKYQDYAQSQVDEQAILDKYNAATLAQFNVQREQNRQAENQFYNQMYNTQRTAMDTIRQSNAAAVSTGASRGVQAANELSALLGLQSESVASATELAQANRQTAQEETAAVLENVLNAYTQAAQERSNLVSQGIEAAAVDAQTEAAAVQAQGQIEATKISTLWQSYLQAQADGNTAAAQLAWNELNKLGGGTSTNPDTNTSTSNIPAPVLTSGIQADGTLKFSTADLNEKNVANVKAALTSAGYTDLKSRMFNINNQAEYDAIKQNDVSTKKFEGKAGEYITKIMQDANADKIPIGATVEMNYGAGVDRLTYIYLGNGTFIEREYLRSPKDMSYDSFLNNYKSWAQANNVYVPDGYRLDTSGPGKAVSVYKI